MIMESGVSDIINGLYNEPDFIKMVKAARLRWLGTFIELKSLIPARN
jgi:hypothetical protein